MEALSTVCENSGSTSNMAMHSNYYIVSCPDPTLLEEKGLVTIQHPAQPSDVAVWHVK